MTGDLLDPLLQLVDRAQHHPREPHQHGARYQGAQGGHDDQPPHDIVGTLLDLRALGPDGRHVHLHNAVEVGTHGLYLGLGDGVAQAGDMLLQGRRKLLFADFGDVLLLERQALAQGVPRDGILADVVQRTEHVPGVLQRIIVVGQDGARSARKLADIADRLDAEQQDHGEQHADAQGKPPLYLHSHDIIKRSMFIRDRRPIRLRSTIAFFSSENNENSGRPTQTILIFVPGRFRGSPRPDGWNAPGGFRRRAPWRGSGC